MGTIVSQKMSRGQGNELLNKLEMAGLSDELAQKVIDSKGNDLAAKVVRLIENGGFQPSTSQRRAQEIMGKNFFGVDEAIKYFGVNPWKHQLDYLAEVPWSEEVLKSSKDTHVLVAVFPLSILDICGKVSRNFFSRSRIDKGREDSWYNKEAFAKDECELGWHLVRKVPVADSTNKTWNEQQALLENVEETPKAQVVVYAIIGHFIATGERLFERIYVRTSSAISFGCHVHVGYFGQDGLDVSSWIDDNRGGNLGLSSALKS